MPIPVSSSPEPRNHTTQSPALACLLGLLAPLQACGGTPPPSAHPALLQGSSAGAAPSHWACSKRYASPHGGHCGGVAVPPPPGLGAVVPGAAEILPRGSEEPSSRLDGSSHPRSQRPRWPSGQLGRPWGQLRAGHRQIQLVASLPTLGTMVKV